MALQIVLLTFLILQEASPASINFINPKTSWENIKLSMDLIPAVKNELSFLRAVDEKSSFLYEEKYVLNAVRRYEECWLPLQAQQQDLNVLPPLDVHWIWHTHMLSPDHYRKDCMALVGRVIDHKTRSPIEIQQRQKSSTHNWESFCPSEPYDFVESQQKNQNKTATYKSRSSYNISAAVQRQSHSNSRILDLASTKPNSFGNFDAIIKYKKFLFLHQLYPQLELTPSLEIDFVWHTHQVHPLIYAADSKKLFNTLLKHDDSIDKNTLHKSANITQLLWNSDYPCDRFQNLSGCCLIG